MASTGAVTLPDGPVLTGGIDDLLQAARWLYSQIGGPPRADVTLGMDALVEGAHA